MQSEIANTGNGPGTYDLELRVWSTGLTHRETV